jgi:phosphonate transport system ATP-binding protein
VVYELRQVRKVFDDGTVALDGLSLTVGSGEQVAVIGPSGAGKTTLFRILNLALRPSAGTLAFEGCPAAALSDADLRRARSRIGTIYQQQNLIGRLRVVHNVLAGNLGRWSTVTALASLVRPRDTGAAAAALAQVGIPEKLYARTDELSGGQQQRVAVARAVAGEPAILLADEPTGNLDSKTSHEIMVLFERLHELGNTILVVTHEHDIAAHTARIVSIHDGRVDRDETVRERRLVQRAGA